MTSLHYACKNGHLDVVKFLVSQAGVYINPACSVSRSSEFFTTPLDLALSNKNQSEDIVSLLVSNGALTMEKIVRIAATRIQALYRSYRIRKSFIEHRDLLLRHERLRRQKAKLVQQNTKVHTAAGSFLGHVVEETCKTKSKLDLKMMD